MASAMATDEEPSTTDKVETPMGRHKNPVCLIVLGMAGSGKTTFVQQLVSKLYTKKTPPYVINLDPACREVIHFLLKSIYVHHFRHHS